MCLEHRELYSVAAAHDCQSRLFGIMEAFKRYETEHMSLERCCVQQDVFKSMASSATVELSTTSPQRFSETVRYHVSRCG